MGHAAAAFEGLYSVVIGTQFAVVGLCLYHSIKQIKDRWLLLAISFSFFISSLGLINDKISIPFTDLINDAFQPVSLLEIVLFAFVLLRRFYHINIEKKEAVQLAQEKTLEALKLTAEKEKLRADAEIGATASQTAHDLASPISSLNMLMKQADTLPEDKRVLMRHSINRINDIVQSLSLKGRKARGLDKASNQLDVTLLASVIESIVSEKRIELRVNGNIELNANFDNTYDLFANVNPVELKRVISNAINNSVEAFRDKSGVIDVNLSGNIDQVIIAIKDNGSGIPPHVLAKLGQRGVSYGKESHAQSGSGLGVYHARTTVEAFGGEYTIESELGKGTTVIIQLKKETPPKWFVQQLVLNDGQSVVAVDDDPSILEIWNQRLAPEIDSSKLKLSTCKTGQCLREWIANHQQDARSAIYLIDYEFLQQKYTGLDLIEELGIKDQAILVSSRYEEPAIIERCKKMGVRAIPKSMAGFVPIRMSPKAIQYDAILIDDDPLIHMMWKHHAGVTGSNVKMYLKPEDLITELPRLDPRTKLYIDNQLANGVKGTEVAFQLYNFGFEELYLSTGSPSDDFENLHYLKGIVGKEPQW